MRLAPGGVIGILGGGQLGRMTALAAARLGYRCHVFAPEPDGPAAQVTNLATIAPYEDSAALTRFAHSVDVITIEFENLPLGPRSRARAREAGATGAGGACRLPGPRAGEDAAAADRRANDPVLGSARCA